jgi:hypothetical protein
MTVTVDDHGATKTATIDSAATGGPVTWTNTSPVANVLKIFPTDGTLLMSKSALDTAVQSLFQSNSSVNVTRVSVKVFLTYLTGCDVNDHPASGMLNRATATFTVGGAIGPN